MTSNALSILLALAGLLSTVPSMVRAQDAVAGEARAQMCIGCHGIPYYQASFPKIYKVPMISGQGAPYLTAALTAYRKGDRKHPTMRAIASALTDKDIADLAAYYERHLPPGAKAAPDAPAAPPAAVAALLTKGACASCHGANYSKPIDPSYPLLAGQHDDYLNIALQSYSDTVAPMVRRNNAIMAAQVKQFSRAELKAMADYLGSLPGALATTPQPRFKWNEATAAAR